MQTQLVGLKDFRQNLSFYSNKLATHGITLIVLKQNKPFLKINGITDNEPIEIHELAINKLSKPILLKAKKTLKADESEFVNLAV